MGPLLEFAQVPVDGITLWLSHVVVTCGDTCGCVSCITKGGGFGKWIKGALDHSVSLIKTLKSTGPSTDP